MMTESLVAALSTYARAVRATKAPASIEDNSAVARSERLQYLVQPRILHWEERATEWSGKPDRISIRLELIEVSSGETLDTTVLSGKSRWATFGGDHPQDLLPDPLSRYANALFEAQACSLTSRYSGPAHAQPPAPTQEVLPEAVPVAPLLLPLATGSPVLWSGVRIPPGVPLIAHR